MMPKKRIIIDKESDLIPIDPDFESGLDLTDEDVGSGKETDGRWDTDES